MSINVVVSGGTAVAITVGGGIGPAGFIVAPGTATNAFGTFQLTAGDGITISTSASQFQVASYSTAAVASFAPVQSVAGRVGNVVLQAADVTAGTFAIARIPTISYTALSNAPTSFAPSAHTHSTADVVSFTAAAAAAAPVQSVAGRTGAISLAVADVSGLAAVASSGSYTSLQNVPATFAPSAHTHGTADITGITSSFAAASHTHSTADVVGLTASFSQVGHTHDYAATIHTHSTADITGYSALPAQGGKAGPLVTDGTAATWTTRYGVVDPVLVQGAGMTLTRDTSAGSITVAFAGGTSGLSVSSATPQPLGTASAGSSGDASRADHVHLMPSAADVGAAATGHSHPYVQVLNGLTGTLTIAGGSGVTVSTASSSITIAAAGGGLSWSSVPASATATGTAGQISYDNANGFFYVATATDTWKRAALASWTLDPYWSSVSLLLHFNGNLTDSSPTPKTTTAAGNAAATGTAQFGSASLSLDGTGDGLQIAGLPIGTEDFTVEFWIRKDSSWTSETGNRYIFDYADSDSNLSGGFQVYLNGSAGVLRCSRFGVGIVLDYSVSSLSATTWYHFAYVRSGTTVTLYKDGSSVASAAGFSGSFGSPATGLQALGIGSYLGNFQSASSWNGQIDEVRITRGQARTITAAPTAAYPDG